MYRIFAVNRATLTGTAGRILFIADWRIRFLLLEVSVIMHARGWYFSGNAFRGTARHIRRTYTQSIALGKK